MPSWYRRVDIRMHGDGKYQELSRPQPNGQTLWGHLLYGPHTLSLPGLSVAGEAMLAEALGWPLEGFREAFREVFAKGMAKADWRARVVWVPNAIKYNPPESPNVVRSWGKLFDSIPECALKDEARSHLKAFIEAMGEGYAKAFRQGFGEALPESPSPSPSPTPSPKGGTRARERAAASRPDEAATSPVVPGESPPPPAAQGETGKAPTANVSATPAQLEMLAGLCAKRALRLPDIAGAMVERGELARSPGQGPLPILKADVDPLIAHLEAIPPVPPAERQRQRAAAEAPGLWSEISRMLDAGAVQEAHDALRAIVTPGVRRTVLRQLEIYLGQRGDLIGAMLAVGAEHETLIRDLPVVWEAMLSSQSNRALGPPGTGLNDADTPDWVS